MDGLDHFWLIFPILTTLCCSLMLAIVLSGRSKWAGAAYLLLIPALFAVYAQAMRVDYFELTEARAERIGRALDAYHVREGHYPQALRELTPWTTLSVPEPVILYGQEWCYDAGDDYYRLGAVSREHWSAPDLTGQLYSAKGDVAVLVAVCDAERFELSERLNSFRRSRE